MKSVLPWLILLAGCKQPTEYQEWARWMCEQPGTAVFMALGEGNQCSDAASCAAVCSKYRSGEVVPTSK